ncbi:MAG: hypothetical protein KatS3mg103_0945 [Phycisphaerales bacterium]|nr:MAG: hypothetical protein KatS3mg103_0945 [Phycisphaerales bacterium]
MLGHARRVRSAATCVLLAVAGAGCSADLARPVILTRPAAEPPVGPVLPAGAVHLGVSARGVPIVARIEGQGPRRLLIIGLIHGDEPAAYHAFEDLWLRITRAGYHDAVTLAGIDTMNPDGYHEQRRGNARGVDLNRNWPASTFRPARRHGPEPLSEPETAAVHRFIERFDPHAVVVFHQIDDGPFVDPDGPEEQALPLARAFADAARLVDPSWTVRSDFTNPPGSLGTWFGIDQRRPILTVELASDTSADSALRATTAGVLAVIRQLADQPAQAAPPPGVQGPSSSESSEPPSAEPSSSRAVQIGRLVVAVGALQQHAAACVHAHALGPLDARRVLVAEPLQGLFQLGQARVFAWVVVPAGLFQQQGHRPAGGQQPPALGQLGVAKGLGRGHSPVHDGVKGPVQLPGQRAHGPGQGHQVADLQRRVRRVVAMPSVPHAGRIGLQRHQRPVGPRRWLSQATPSPVPACSSSTRSPGRSKGSMSVNSPSSPWPIRSAIGRCAPTSSTSLAPEGKRTRYRLGSPRASARRSGTASSSS